MKSRIMNCNRRQKDEDGETEKADSMVYLGAIGAVLTILAAGIVVPALSYLLSFAAGAMLYVVVEELIPEMSQGQHSNVGTVFLR